jgi:mono/diheme cytochrome c family protein
MKRLVFTLFVLAAVTTQPVAQTQTSQPSVDRTAAIRSMLDTYCIGCHSSTARAGGVAFAGMSLDDIGSNAEVWEKAVRKLRGRLMPPPGSRQPDQAQVDVFIAALEDALDKNATAAGHPVAGRVPIQRMTRTEYATAVKDLLGVEIDAENLLPTEIEVGGFENIAAALSISPAFLDQYVGAARLAAKLAVGDAVPKQASTRYPLPPGNQAAHIDGLPLGTRGGMKFRHNFPADGEYRFTVLDLDVGLYTRTMETRHTLVLLVDGREVFRKALGGLEDLSIVDHGGAPGRAQIMERFKNIPVQVHAGVHDIVVTFIVRAEIETDEFVNSRTDGNFGTGLRAPRMIDGVTVMGPFNSPGVSKTLSRDRIFICQPETREARGLASPKPEREARGLASPKPEREARGLASPKPEEREARGLASPKPEKDDPDCARRIIENLARRAFRRPVTKVDVDSLMPYFEAGRKEAGGFDAGIEQALAAVLVSPDFLYRTIRAPATKDSRDPNAFPLSDLELASRLSFFLWSQGPDEALLKVATEGKLKRPEVLEAQARRMLADSRASSLVRNFALKWLNVYDLNAVQPDPLLFPSFNDQLRRDMRVEIESFVSSVLLQDRNVNELLTANHTFLNERLARHYGITSVFGPQFRRVELQDPQRWGLLGKGAVLLRTSYGDRTSPVLRGAWVLDKLMGTPPTPPPPDVDTDLSTPKGEKPKTLRARMEQHRSKPSCNQCHGVIDPIGLALENFDAIGRWRDVDALAEAPIDAKTVLPNGRGVDGPAQLRQQLFIDTGQFAQALTQKLMMYALGRELEYFDMPQVRAIVHRAAKEDYRLSAIVSGIVTSDAFRMQAVK